MSAKDLYQLAITTITISHKFFLTEQRVVQFG